MIVIILVTTAHLLLVAAVDDAKKETYSGPKMKKASAIEKKSDPKSSKAKVWTELSSTQAARTPVSSNSSNPDVSMFVDDDNDLLNKTLDAVQWSNNSLVNNVSSVMCCGLTSC